MTDEGYQPFPDIGAWVAVPFDPATYDQYSALLGQARDEATEEAREHAVRTAIRYAGTDTGAIEGLYTTDRGFTRTVAIEAAHWEAAANERGPNAAQLIKDQIEAYEWLLDLVTESRPVTESVIRELHTILCRSQETYVVHTEVGSQERALPKGEYKQFPNNPTSLATGQIRHYAPPDMVAPEVHRLVESLSSGEYRNAHPVVQAAYLHYSLVAIHPFADGNGRTTRALASVPLYRALRVPLIVFRDQRDEYLDTLAAADTGDVVAFLRFVAERTVDAAALVVETTRLGPGEADRQRSLATLRRATEGTVGLTEADFAAAASRLVDHAASALQEHVNALDLPSGVRVTLTEGPGPPPQPAAEETYRRVSHEVGVHVWVGAFTTTVAAGRVTAYLSRIDRDRPFLLHSSVDGLAPIEFEPADLIPQVRQVAQIRLDAWLTQVLDRILADAAEEVSAPRTPPPR